MLAVQRGIPVVVCAASWSHSRRSSTPCPIQLTPHADCAEPPQNLRRRSAVDSTSGICERSGVRFYAARSRATTDSPHRFVLAERLHHFAVVDGACGEDGGAQCATFCAERIVQLTCHSFREQVRRLPLHAMTSFEGHPLPIPEAAAQAWREAFLSGFAFCEEMVQASDIKGGCGALLCVVTRSGTYIGSIGLGRAVVGVETDDGHTVVCDAASIPHTAESEIESLRLGDSATSRRERTSPTRLLGALAEKRADDLLGSSPDIVRIRHEEARRFVLLASPDLWLQGPRLPVHWAVEAFREGRNPADEVVARSKGDVVALVLVLPPGIGDGNGDALPMHDEIE